MVLSGEFFTDLELNEARFLSTLTSLISETTHLQNHPAAGLVPKEDLASDHVLQVLSPYSKENGGPLLIQVDLYLDIVILHILISYIGI